MSSGSGRDAGRKTPGSSKSKSSSSKSSSSKPAGRGFVARQAAADSNVNQLAIVGEASAKERVLREKAHAVGTICIDDVLQLDRATSDFLMNPAKSAPIRFRRLKVTIGESDGEVLFDQCLVEDDSSEMGESVDEAGSDLGGDDEVSAASEVVYILPASSLGAMCTAYTEFKATEEIQDFYMIERFFYEDVMLKDLRFSFGFCIPGSINTASITYDTPEISDDLRQKIIANPKRVRADSFYFRDGVLFMHYKSNYTYVNMA
ncbi:protein unc-119 homolog B-like [Sycon ciliatum]|uniref:protein unc-119 homolog B-like n=1 Tax=Sycon ciliatum TaxID=27933 RepID=UPI0020AE6B7E|eukprot:scpid73652/ scgid15336/ Protein unc-119 homolog B